MTTMITVMIHYYNCPLIGWLVAVKSKDTTPVGVKVWHHLNSVIHPPTVTVPRGQLPYVIDFLVAWLLFEQNFEGLCSNTYYINQWSLGHRTFVHNIFFLPLHKYINAFLGCNRQRVRRLQFIERCAIIGSSYRYWGSINIQCPLDFKPLLSPSASR